MRTSGSVAAIIVWAFIGSLGCEGERPLVGASSDDVEGPVPSGAASGTVQHWIEYVDDDPQLCLPRTLPLTPDGTAACVMLSMRSAAGAECGCDAPGRAPASNGQIELVRTKAAEADACVCQVLPASDDGLAACLNDPAPGSEMSGWCYVTSELGNPALVADCPDMTPQRLRFLGTAAAEADETFYIACSGSPWKPPVSPLGGVCLPELELHADFAGFSLAEVNVELDSASCESNVCLVHNFVGRVSCPYGQTAASGGCVVPGSNAPVMPSVTPQLLTRPPEAAAICSCRCDGPGSGPFCSCPSGMECAPLVPSIGLAGEESYVGSYCVPEGSRFDPISASGEQCLAADQNCGDERPF
jgi:hypothetical protein